MQGIRLYRLMKNMNDENEAFVVFDQSDGNGLVIMSESELEIITKK